MNFLENILQEKAEEIQARRRSTPVECLKDSVHYERPRLSFVEALRSAGFGIIAEIKKASPSKGLLRAEFDPVRIAQSYQMGGACALSVLTDEKFFQGSLAHLRQVRESVGLPILRKDFILDSYQLHEARSAGADAVLLIVAALDSGHLRDLNAEANELGLETLIEVHNLTEAELALGLSPAMIGVNNRDLATFKTTLETSLRLAPMLQGDVLGVSESGIGKPEDLALLAGSGYHAALVGEAFMREKDPGDALKKLMEGYRRIST